MNRKSTLSAKDAEKIYGWTVHGGAENASDTERADYEAWLQDKPARLHKAGRVESVWHHPDFEAAVQLVGGRLPIEAIATAPTRVRQRNWYFATAAAILILAPAAVLFQLDAGEPTTNRLYTTESQQTSRMTLADGSTLDLSGSSKVSVDFSDESRQIRLYDGEAQFTVAKDALRPFVVESRQASMRALGTVFNVDQRGAITELRVLEGTVAVHAQKRPDRVLEVSAGEWLRVSADAAGPVGKFDLASYKGWLQGLVEVENMRLSELLIEFNRFSAVPLIARDHETGNLQVTGSFDLSEIDNNIRILATLHGLTVSNTGEEIVLGVTDGD